MDAVIVTADALGSRLRVWVVSGTSRSAVDGRHGDALKVRVTSPAERGRANSEMVRLVADHFGCQVTLVAGHRSRAKTVLLHGLSPAAATALLPA